MSYWVVDANIAIQTVLDITDNLERFWKRIDLEQITPWAPTTLVERNDLCNSISTFSKGNRYG